MADYQIPTEAERDLIAKDVVITKLKRSESNIQPIFHKWRDIWADDLLFILKNGNPEIKYRAIAITMPMYFVDDTHIQELTFRGYVTGLAKTKYQSGNIQIFPIEEIKWEDFGFS